jgi:2-polyprenyl-6-methoxyphenol hydroxylase-like FAD-dependent oxidoreductase
MPPSPTTDVLVVGAGPVGVLLAGELLRHGVTCRVVDGAAEPMPFCKALGVQSRTLEIFEDLGVVGRALELGCRLKAANTYRDGQRVQRVEIDGEPLPDVPYPLALSLEQNLTEQILTEHLRQLGGDVERPVSCSGFTMDDDGVTASLDGPGGKREQVRCRFLVGCDGAHSTVRKTLGVAFEGGSYPETFVLADVEVQWPLAPDESHVFHAGEQFLVAVPIRGHGRFRLSTRDDSPGSTGAPDHGLFAGEAAPPTVEQLQAVVDRVGPPGTLLHNPRWTSRYRISHRLAARYRQGRVFLAGDAAHIHPPTGGQGMNTGLQDAYNLAWKLALVVKGQGRPELLDSYEAERRPVGQEVLQKTDQAMKSREEESRRPAGDPRAAKRELLRRWAQLDVNYRGGPLAEQHGDGGEVRAGDRAPDARLLDVSEGRSVRLFDLFRGPQFTLMAWQVAPDIVAALADLPGKKLLLRTGDSGVAERPSGWTALTDLDNTFRDGYGLKGAALVLVRPDKYVGFLGSPPEPAALRGYLQGLLL